MVCLCVSEGQTCPLLSIFFFFWDSWISRDSHFPFPYVTPSTLPFTDARLGKHDLVSFFLLSWVL